MASGSHSGPCRLEEGFPPKGGVNQELVASCPWLYFSRTWRSWPGSRKSCVRLISTRIPSPLLQAEKRVRGRKNPGIRPLLPFCRRGCAEHLGIQRAMRTAEGERCVGIQCVTTLPHHPRVGGWVSFTRGEGSAI